MKRFSEQFNIKAQAIKLKASERRDLRERLVAYMEYHPRPGTVTSKAASPSSFMPQSEPFRVVSFNIFSALRWSAAAVVVLLVGTSYVAENTIPGDALYAVKVNINEEVLSTLALSPYEKVTWETERLNRRIAEARVLASEGKLTDSVEEDVVKAVREHSENARREIAELKETDSQEATLASIQLASALDVQSIALQMGENTTGAPQPGAALLASVLEESKKSNDLEPVQELPTYDRLLARLETDTTRAHELLNSVSPVATKEEQHDITRRLEDIERAMATAMGSASDNDQKAREVLFEAIHSAQKLIVFMANIDVRTAMNVESVVPVVLTADERHSNVEQALKEVVRLQAVITEGETGAEVEAAVRNKAELTVKRMTELANQSKAALAGGDLTVAEVTSHEAVQLAQDVLGLLGLSTSGGEVDPAVTPNATTSSSTGTSTPPGRVEGISATGTASSTATGTVVIAI